MNEAESHAVERIGQVAVAGRYHHLPRRLEDDFKVSSSVLGSGFNGSVFSAQSRHTGMTFAIKNLSLEGQDAVAKKQLATEVEIFLGMDHPHVARLMSVYETEHEVSLVMECMSGGELFDRARDVKVFEESKAADAMWQMLLSVNYLHHEGVTHRDLKLENFLYDQKGSDFLKLIDFGFSKYCKGKKVKEALGTLTYVAPEVLARNYTHGSCDMWSLGCIAFILLFGYMPFSAADDRALVKKICAGSYAVKDHAWKRVSNEGQDFVRKLLVARPDARMTAEQALKHRFIERHVQKKFSDVTISKDVVDGFICMAEADAFRRICLQVMAWSLPLSERQKLRDEYIYMASNQDGVVKLADLQRVMQAKLKMPDDQVAQVAERLKVLDVDGDGELHYSDFLAGMIAMKLRSPSKSMEDVVFEAFRRFDARGEGEISAENFKLFHAESQESLDSTFASPSLSRSGRMTSQEFAAFHLGREVSQVSSTACPAKACPGRTRDRFFSLFGSIFGCIQAPVSALSRRFSNPLMEDSRV